MKKRLLTILAVLVLMVAVLPMAVSADECEHNGTKSYPNNNDGATHKIYCWECGQFISEAAPHEYSNGTCICGALKPAEACDHENVGYANRGETHEVYCNDCPVIVNAAAPHVFNNGTCVCGANDPDYCAHEWHSLVNNGETHTVKCRDCENVVIQEGVAHDFSNGDCACGAAKPVCTHENTSLVNKGETHDVVCQDCPENVETGVAHDFTNGDCVCGAKNPVCDHEWKGVVNNGETHDVVCRDCLEVLEDDAAHDFSNGDCPCGAAHTCDFAAGITSNKDGTHDVNCVCGQFVQMKCQDNDGDGACDACGYVKYEAPEEDEEPVEKASDEGLDYVPKTGSFFLEWLYALIFG